MRWTSRLKRMGGMAAIVATRQRQVRLLVEVQKIPNLVSEAKLALEYLRGNQVRYLTGPQEEFFAAHIR